MISTSLTLRCIGRRADTHDVTSWQFVATEGTLPAVLAGQCVTLHTEIDGKPQCRAYTLSSSPQDPFWQVTIKDVGLVSHHLHQTLQLGDEIRVDGPFGDFNLAVLHCERPLLLSAGSGITPMWAMLRDELAKRPNADIRFIHSARSPEDVIFASDLAALAEAHAGVRHALVLEQAPAAYPWVGRLTPAMLRELAPDLLARHVYLCGPAPYMAAVCTMLAELGLPAEQLHQESFGLPAGTSSTAPVAAGSDHFWLTLKKSGKKVKILPGQTLLAALEGAGETMVAACRAGVCGACRCTTEGEIERQSVMTLSAQDLERGVALACSCTIRGDVSVDY
ncbi:MAG: hybrid-cluster NAD(P)-dependent oxidoreductase [Aeromonas sp.]|jgi:NADH oxidoreductase Hcr|uniref:2Fe-2S iron-sulfur cluster binding domain-containing protein n=1 Tax=Aeromonas media TaxID=651 RepID=A0AAE6SL70_AERME|nr:hybrid-cluster NAD(P)-dependent oxidoreductase [Aeromonas media]MBP6071868.1 hybrid-cluster NAD(P)-dependent oxidoreductase [Aeromonas sp.]MBP6167037.1 hybrid-cluster NAD(P)-dependent oxidoreductase [Aeromonas sp.]MBP8079665.1 hybrid-cluster NAD(P)-dependent oxidoreductase [Aeromonas sp.]MBP8112267.1 hybrid-cluster NAD(P)-dependent oxidoreductase [Aeromonas sp.]MBP8152650.1 hybrid-cluster NAD(P)-dependent oxidoreductase [Aeromonas sp.]